MKNSNRFAGLGVVALAAIVSVDARADGAGLKEALSKTKPIVDLRLRQESVDQDPILRDAHATTFRARLGFETGKFANTSLLIEGEGVVPLRNHYRPDPAAVPHPHLR